MSRYELIDNRPVKITVATIDGYKVSNPSDAMLDAEGIGYTYTPADPPEVTDETKTFFLPKTSSAFEVPSRVRS